MYKYSIVGIWISLFGAIVLLCPVLKLLHLELSAIFQPSMGIVWETPSFFFIIIGLLLWSIFPAIFIFSYNIVKDRNEYKKIILSAKIVNIMLVILPIIVIFLTQFTLR